MGERDLAKQTQGVPLPNNIPVVDRRKLLPDDAVEIAGMCSKGLALPSLQEPFTRFLLAVGEIEDLAALGIAFSGQQGAKTLTLYGFHDLRHMFTSPSITGAHLRKTHSDLFREIHPMGKLRNLTVPLLHVNTLGEPIDTVLSDFVEETFGEAGNNSLFADLLVKPNMPLFLLAEIRRKKYLRSL